MKTTQPLFKRWLPVIALLALWPVMGFAQSGYQVITSFGSPADQSGIAPHAALIQGQDGAFYGTTEFGGNAGHGTVFKVNPDGSGYAVVYHFTTNATDGNSPLGALVQGPDGNLYGTTPFGGSNDCGTVFKVNTNGGGYMVLHYFLTNAVDAQNPFGGLLQDANGTLYGTASRGSSNGVGAVFSLNQDGGGFTVLHSFATNNQDGGSPLGLVLATDGTLYGLTRNGFTANYADTIFKMNTNGLDYQIIGTNLTGPASAAMAQHTALLLGNDGALYGAWFNQGVYTSGVIFKVGTNGAGYSVLHDFSTNAFDGNDPDTRLVQDANGTLYGSTTLGGSNSVGTVFKMNPDGGGYTVLHQFTGTNGDGSRPADALLLGADGTLYGTTPLGGIANGGTIFGISTNGTGYAVLRHFGNSPAGCQPSGRLTQGDDGAWYGTTGSGGTNNQGTLYKVNATGDGHAVLYHFGAFAGDGQNPSGKLLRGWDGAWYGTTVSGGDSNKGTLYKINQDGGGYALLHSFDGPPDGSFPAEVLLQATNGALYGTTSAGGTNDMGTVFKVNPDGNDYTVLRSFFTNYAFKTNFADGLNPAAGVIQTAGGTLYGTTTVGGTNYGGTLFKINPNGDGYQVVRHFGNNSVDGTGPAAPLVQGPDGVLYGTTEFGGNSNAGTVFKINPDGTGYSILRNLSFNAGDAHNPVGELLLASDGKLYLTTADGMFTNAPSAQGTVFRLDTGGSNYQVLHNFVSGAGDGLNPASGLTEVANGQVYGVTTFGGGAGNGTIYVFVSGDIPAITLQPTNATVLWNGNYTFNAAATGGGLQYQWFFNDVAVNQATNALLPLSSLVRSNGGVYYLQVTNLLGTAIGSNAVLTIQVPNSLSAPTILPDGGFQLTSAYADAEPLQPADLPRFEAQFSSNLLDWLTLSNSLSISNNALWLNDPGASNQPVRFYRIVEHP